MNVLITGASSGIGKACAEIFLKNKHTVYNLSRTPSSVPNIINIKCDITNPSDIKEAFKQIPKLDVLINNAGFGISGALEYTKLEDLKKQFELNIFAQVEVTKAAIPLLRKSKKAKIIFTSSAASVFSIPFQSFYSATKSAIETIAASLSTELKAFKIQVGYVRLGDIKTGFTDNRAKDYDGDDVYNGQIKRSVAVMEHDERNGMNAEDVAKVYYKLATKRKLPLQTTVGLKYQAYGVLAKYLPTQFVNTIVGILYMPKK